MAKYQDNNWYLDIDGTDLSSYIVSLSVEQSVESVDITAGSGTDDRQRGVGLRDISVSFDIYHDDGAAYALTLIAPGIHTITIGLEGSASGKPKHVQSMLIESAPFETTVEKPMVNYSVSAVGAAAPSTNMFAGGVWA
jgi:hypothetical protein